MIPHARPCVPTWIAKMGGMGFNQVTILTHQKLPSVFVVDVTQLVKCTAYCVVSYQSYSVSSCSP